MLLTDPAVQYWSCVVAVLATLAALMLWNRVRGPRAVRALSRLGLLLGGYAATAVAVLVSVNIAYGGLVVSVDDLFADINPPMGQYLHHHRSCGSAATGPSASASAVAPAPAVPADPAVPAAPAVARPQQPAAGRAAGDPWARPCPQPSSGDAQAADRIRR
jgi:hypothetical protein